MTGTAEPGGQATRPDTARRRAAAAAARMQARSFGNLRRSWGLIGARVARRRAANPAFPWPMAAVAGLTTVVIAALILDAPVGAYRGRWPQWLQDAAALTTDVGLGGWYIAPAALIVLALNLVAWDEGPRRRLRKLYSWNATAMFILCATGLSGLIATLLKRVIGRARPEHFSEVGAFGFDFMARSSSYASFPSGHATIVGSVAMVLALFFPKWRLLIIPVAGWIAATRIVAGVHYPSDVAAGLLFGASFTLLTAIVFARLGYVFTVPAKGLPERRRALTFF